MKRSISIFLGLCLLAALGSAQGMAGYQQQFWAQLSGTCQPALRWQKSVTTIAEDGSETTETKVFDVDCLGGHATAGTTTIDLDPAEFGHLWEYAYDNPYVADKLEVVASETSLEARAKSGQEEDSKLRLQRFKRDPSTHALTLAEAHIVKGSPLYDLEVHIAVYFSPDGRYLRHEVETQTRVLLGSDLHTRIVAQLLN